MIKDGKGGSKTNAVGIKFEKQWNFKEVLENFNYHLNKTIFSSIHEVIDEQNFCKGFIGENPNKEFYKFFDLYLSNKFNQTINLEFKGSLLYPDKFYFDVIKQKLHIIEYKIQNVSGSTDEKIQTAPYKKYFYSNIFLRYGIGIEFIYVWNEWFNHQRYDGVKDFLDQHQVKYYVNELMLGDLDL